MSRGADKGKIEPKLYNRGNRLGLVNNNGTSMRFFRVGIYIEAFGSSEKLCVVVS